MRNENLFGTHRILLNFKFTHYGKNYVRRRERRHQVDKGRDIHDSGRAAMEAYTRRLIKGFEGDEDKWAAEADLTLAGEAEGAVV